MACVPTLTSSNIITTFSPWDGVVHDCFAISPTFCDSVIL